ncbi:MAG: hypothetical protein Alis3KO_28940 [Aliiglaciecola sp.]
MNVSQFIKVFLIASALCACGGKGDSSQPPPAQSPSPLPTTDTSPDTFSFPSVFLVTREAVVESVQVTVTGIDSAAAVSVQNGEFRINGGQYQSATDEINNGDTLQVRLTASSDYDTIITAIILVGDLQVEFSIETEAAPPVADALVEVKVNVAHTNGDVSTFEREKFITIHASHTENDWYTVGTNASEDLITEFVEGYDVYFGRDTGHMAWQLRNTPEDPERPGFSDINAMQNRADSERSFYSNNGDARAISQRRHEHRNRNMIVAAQQHPYWPDGKLTGQGWAFSQQDILDEPLGTATGEYIGNYVARFFNSSVRIDTSGQPKPRFVEVMNEPLYELFDVATSPANLDTIFEFHNTVANEIRNVQINGTNANDNVLIGGYTAAFPDFDKNDFDRWRNRHKRFIDLAGQNMDFLSIHLYDWPAFNGTVQLRTGSNVEATLDLLRQYSSNTLGAPLPLVISEYGTQVHNMLNQPWSPERDGFVLDAMNGLVMSFLQRPDQILSTIPFVPIKAEWGRTDVPYNWRLMRQQKEADGEVGEDYVYTDIVKFYQFWKDVEGDRVVSQASDLDIQTVAYKTASTLYLVINNADILSHTARIEVQGLNQNNIANIELRRLYNDQQGTPHLDLAPMSEIPDNIEMPARSSMLVVIEMNQVHEASVTLDEKHYYSPTMTQSISANQQILIPFNGISTSENGWAVLRLGIAREHDRSLQPNVSLNGQILDVPSDYRGYDQLHNGRGRDNFYGVIEIPVPITSLGEDCLFSLSFPDAGGIMASATLAVFAANGPLNN